MTEAEERAAVVAEARKWIGTPYHHAAMIRGVGVDCATLLAAVYSDAGVVDVPALLPYSPQFFLHRSDEKYLAEVMKYAHETTDPKPGDIVVYKMGRSFAHGAIIVDPGWPAIIHAVQEAGMVYEDRGDAGRLAGREHRFFTRW